MNTIVQLAAGVEVEPCDLLVGMVWKLDHLAGADAPGGGFEVKIGNRWERV